MTFDPNGGEGEMPKQKFLIKEDGSLEQKTLKGNKFTNKQGDVVKIFNGWTISPVVTTRSITKKCTEIDNGKIQFH